MQDHLVSVQSRPAVYGKTLFVSHAEMAMTTSSNDLFANVSHVSRQVVPRPMIQGKLFADAERDGGNNTTSLLEISVTQKAYKRDVPSAKDLFDAQMVADRFGNAGIESGTGQSQMIIGKPKVLHGNMPRSTNNVEMQYRRDSEP